MSEKEFRQRIARIQKVQNLEELRIQNEKNEEQKDDSQINCSKDYQAVFCRRKPCHLFVADVITRKLVFGKPADVFDVFLERKLFRAVKISFIIVLESEVAYREIFNDISLGFDAPSREFINYCVIEDNRADTVPGIASPDGILSAVKKYCLGIRIIPCRSLFKRFNA